MSAAEGQVRVGKASVSWGPRFYGKPHIIGNAPLDELDNFVAAVAGARREIGESGTPVDTALAVGRQAADILQAPPENPDTGYVDDEVAAQYAATDRLIESFQQLDKHISNTE